MTVQFSKLQGRWIRPAGAARAAVGLAAALLCGRDSPGQSGPTTASSPAFSLRNGSSFIGKTDLPPDLASSLQAMGGRMMSADEAAVTIVGTVTDEAGTRPAQITVQAPGYLRYQENDSNARVLTFNGTQFQAKNSTSGVDDERVEESLFAHLPDAVFLQLATSGGTRRVGRNFRTDNGTTPNYAGPYWTLYAYAPAGRAGLNWGGALQQSFFIALDQSTGLISEIRVVSQSPTTAQSVTQTKFNKWFQQSGQWFPGEIVRFENGTQVLTFETQQGTAGGQMATSSFTP